MVIVLMGVSGSGKTTLGRKLAAEMTVPFYDADDYHPDANIEKMSRGHALSERDRLPWLKRLESMIRQWRETDRTLVLACSALSRKSRERLRAGSDAVRFVYLRGRPSLIRRRLNARQGHYMPADLLESQFEALEEPRRALTVEASLPPEEAVAGIREGLGV